VLEALAWVAGFSVLLGVFLPDFRQVEQNILIPLGVVFGVITAYWLGSKPVKGSMPVPAFETTASLTTQQPGRVNNYEPPFFGALLTPLQFVPEPTLSEKLRGLGGSQFERVLELIFQNRGFCVRRLNDANLDGGYDAEVGIDLTIESTAEKYAVQYKHWRKWSVDARQIREFLNALTDHRFHKGIFITLTGCTREARQLAEKHGIQILDEAAIIDMLVESGLMYDQRIYELLSDEPKFKYCSK